jgi:DMSO/TMAO reductase YedYZ molybdopterin-dependent catalytic subunit
LLITGRVEHEIELSLDDLKSFRVDSRVMTLECAGNGRVFLIPQENGAQWELGAVSNAEWTGVRLSDVLSQSGLESNVSEIIFEGADSGQPDETPRPEGEIHYSHSIPLAKIGDTLLAYQMNGQPCPIRMALRSAQWLEGGTEWLR